MKSGSSARSFAVSYPRISVVIATYNEQRRIAECIRSVLDGSLGTDEVEVVVADGGSTDRTREVVSEIAAEHPNIRLIDNPGQTAPTGFNCAIRASRGDTICVLGAHSCLDPDYLARSVEKLESSDFDVVGGPMVTEGSVETSEARLVQAILSSRFGVGRSFRTQAVEGPVDTVSFGVYRRSVFERIGLYDERLARNQDSELNSRVRAAGGQVWMIPSIWSHYFSRSTLGKMFSQNYHNGLYGILSWRINPASFTLRHAIPFAFVLFLLIGGVLAALNWHLRVAFIAVLGLYVLGAIAASVQVGVQQKTAVAVLLPILFPALHVAYGLGTLVGVFRFGICSLAEGGPEKLPPREGNGALGATPSSVCRIAGSGRTSSQSARRGR